MPRELKPCGTRAAYKRHLRNGEEPCGPCLRANQEESTRSRAKDRVPEQPIEVPPDPEASEPTLEEELRWQAKALKFAIVWSAEFDPGKMPALAKERRETLAKLAELGADESEGGALGEFLSGPVGVVGGAAPPTRARA